MLTQAGLNNTKIAQVMDIQKKTMTTVRQDRVHVRLLKAEMAVALLPANVDMQAVNNLITQEAQMRAAFRRPSLERIFSCDKLWEMRFSTSIATPQGNVLASFPWLGEKVR